MAGLFNDEGNVSASDNNNKGMYGSGDVVKDATSFNADRAEASAANAKDSEDAAAVSETNAAASEGAAASSAVAAAGSAIDADASAVAATSSESGASLSAISASDDAIAADASAAAALVSEGNAATSETNAGNSAASAAADAVATAADRVVTSQDALDTAADAVATAADRVQTGLDVVAASGSASDADASAIAADASASDADASAIDANAAKVAAELAETNALASENAAALSESNAATSESNASTSATNALNSSIAASSHAANALASENAAALSESNAATSETSAEGWATNAQNSALNALTYKNDAETARTGAELAETNAQSSEDDAAISEVNAAASAAIAESSVAGAMFQNAIINGDMSIWQRGTPIASGVGALTYAADRHIFFANGASLDITKFEPDIEEFKWGAAWNGVVGNTGLLCAQRVLAEEMSRFNTTDTCRYSAWIYTPVAREITVVVDTPNAVDDFSGPMTQLHNEVVEAATIVGFNLITFDVPMTQSLVDNGMQIYYNIPDCDAGIWAITGISFVKGSGGAWEWESKPQNLLRCQRYYWKDKWNGRFRASVASEYTEWHNRFPTQMRAIPTVVETLAGSRQNVATLDVGSVLVGSARMSMKSTTSGDTYVFGVEHEFIAEV